MTPNDSRPTKKELDEAKLCAAFCEDSRNKYDTAILSPAQKACIVLAREVLALEKDLAEARKERHPDHSHCVTPCDSIRIQDENHSAWQLAKERAERAEAENATLRKALAEAKERIKVLEANLRISDEMHGDDVKKHLELSAENAMLKKRIERIDEADAAWPQSSLDD